MYRKLFLSVSLLMLIFNLPAAFAQSTVVSRSPYYNQYNHRYIMPYSNPYNRSYYSGGGNLSENFTDWSAQKEYALRKNYIVNNKLDRLQRLERQIFGAVQQGDFDERYQRVREAVSMHPPKPIQKSVLRRISDYFAGQITGFEPPVSDDFIYESDYLNGYGNTSSYSHRTNPWNQGYGINGYGIGNSGGIRILD